MQLTHEYNVKSKDILPKKVHQCIKFTVMLDLEIN